MSRLLWASACVLLSASSAHAYCRTRTSKDPIAGTCPEACRQTGFPLAWPTHHLSYTFNENGFPGIADVDLRRMIAASIGAWEAVDCEGDSVGLDSVAVEQPSSLTAPRTPEEAGESEQLAANLIVRLEADDWNERDLSPQAFAITAVWFRAKNGDILGADMMFNGRMDDFGECHDTGCTDGDPHVDLRNVATHEFGHFLGLAHSDVEGSAMWCDAKPGEVNKRTLKQDDIDGLCAIYPPNAALESPRARSKSRGCALWSDGELSWMALPLLALIAARRKRAR